MKTFLLTSALILVLVQPFESAPAYADRKYMEGYGYGEENQRTYRKPCIEHPKNRGHNPND